MSLMAMSTESARSSGFTFESSVHPSNVLHALDEQRRRDVFCDVTVLAEGRSFRAHRSVLASCSEWFTARVSSHCAQGSVITLPQEVTSSGFEPLLKFAYTSKLHFSKDTVFEIRNCATILGFKDLDKACFDFLLPKFFHSDRGPAPRKACCMKKCKRLLPSPGLHKNGVADEKQISVFDPTAKEEPSDVTPPRSQAGNAETGSKSDSLGPSSQAVVQSESSTDYSLQCPKYRKFQLACGKEACGSDKSRELQEPALAQGDCCLPCPVPRVCGQAFTDERSPKRSFCRLDTRTGRRTDVEDCYPPEVKGQKDQEGLGECRERRRDQGERSGGKARETAWPSPGTVKEGQGEAVEKEGVTPGRSSPDKPLAVEPRTEEKVGGEKSRGVQVVMNWLESGGEPCPDGIRQPSLSRGRSDIEKEEDTKVKERGDDSSVKESELEKTKGQCAELSSSSALSPSIASLKDAGGLWAEAGGSRGSCLSPCEWRKLQMDLGTAAAPATCPYLLDLEQGGQTGPGGPGAALDCRVFGTCVEDGESEGFDTDGDSGSCSSERARQVKLPFPVGQVVALNRNDFQQMLKQQSLTRDQLHFVHDVRRRSKNRIAARRCRKRKLDGIHDLEGQINKLRLEREKLKAEKGHLSLMKQKTWEGMKALCQRVCSQAYLDPEQLQLLADSPDCPLSSLLSLTDPPGTGAHTPLRPQASSSAGRSSVPGIPAEVP
ncbi:transcription regulator protein BACH1b [Aplochiton taeniatus]